MDLGRKLSASVIPSAGLEPATRRFEGDRSTLSYEGVESSFFLAVRPTEEQKVQMRTPLETLEHPFFEHILR